MISPKALTLFGGVTTMNYTTLNGRSQVYTNSTHPNPDDPSHFAKDIFNIVDLEHQAYLLNLDTSKPTLNRIRRALAILHKQDWKPIAVFEDERIYFVKSQTTPNESYTVLSNGKVQCQCPDYAVGYHCKHAIAIQMIEQDKAQESERDETLCDAMDEYYNDRINFPIPIFE